jgi:hypothetical protein
MRKDFFRIFFRNVFPNILISSPHCENVSLLKFSFRELKQRKRTQTLKGPSGYSYYSTVLVCSSVRQRIPPTEMDPGGPATANSEVRPSSKRYVGNRRALQLFISVQCQWVFSLTCRPEPRKEFRNHRPEKAPIKRRAQS